MNTELGTVFVALGLAASLLAVVNQIYGLITKRSDLLSRVQIPVLIMFFAAVGQVAVMERALITRDFTVAYVAQHGSTRTPALFNVATLWSALEGSILLWVLILVGYLGLVVWRFKSRLGDPLVAWAVTVISIVCVFFFLLLMGPAYPFGEFDPWPGFDGPGPNPLLQNHILMAFHPPILYLGYVGMTVPFSFAIAALITGRVGEGWLLQTRKWTLIAWGCLSLGIILGSWWSYEILGWGGYWAWDPVENASFLPWLTSTAFLHSVMIQEKKGMLRVWNLSLLCATFSLTILGTFITRSGVLESVHSFTESGIGPLLLGFFLLVVITSVGLIAWRGESLRSPGSITSPLSRTGAFLLNNLLFGCFAFVVFLGTVFPLVIEALNGDRISVGNPYFVKMSTPIGFALLFMMAIAPALSWGKTDLEVLSKRLTPSVVCGSIAMLIGVVLGSRGIVPTLALGFGGFAAGSAIKQILFGLRTAKFRGLLGRNGGGMIVHLGVVILAVALACSSSFLRQAEFKFEQIGDEATLGGHEFKFDGIERVELKEKNKIIAKVFIDDELFKPSINQFPFGGRSIGTPTTRSTWKDDVQLAVLAVPEESEQKNTVIRVTIQPLVWWIWFGGGVMVLGTIFSLFSRRKTLPEEPVMPSDENIQEMEANDSV
ncbi:MAG: heme lyase CcmF/NrfE family subunit [Acidimicrobiales bacterium]|jgi:cytochrome c-type biogenesis protein CcmF|nr:heme lyase CcmF/NrfE family subunit [Acidimicrobiales bacterium]MDP6894729.1 heme lyase CcmF/NrfE family subunit [Acidimicrobiales bacterium]|tara:strand:- start:11749 stop:13722 length:1974 start_codon:yes stop_codon:yes gene_type:complete